MQQSIPPVAPQRAALRRMQFMATGLLVLCLATLVFARSLEPRWPALAAFIERQKSGVSRFISAQAKSWDMAHMTELVETRIGRDLQYIRFNGALIGGLIGLGLYAVMHAFGPALKPHAKSALARPT